MLDGDLMINDDDRFMMIDDMIIDDMMIDDEGGLVMMMRMTDEDKGRGYRGPKTSSMLDP